MRSYDEDDEDAVSVFDDEPQDMVHNPPLLTCPGRQLSQDCVCPAVRPLTQTISRNAGIGPLIRVQLCICCGGVPA